MAITPTAKIRVGDIAEIGFVVRTKTGALTSPTAVSIEITDHTGTLIETITDADARVTIGATLGTALAAELGLSAAENTAGAGIVAVEVTPTAAGTWNVYCVSTGTVASESVNFKVWGKTE